MPRPAALGPTPETRAGALFVGDEELRRRLFPDLGVARAKAIVAAWEMRGFPRRDATVRGRYWPAVQAWLDREYGLIGPALGGRLPSHPVPDGDETWT